MSVSEALKTTFKGDGPTTQVVIPRKVAEQDWGRPFGSDAEFARWIDDNNDRIYASAKAKRETSSLYESVTFVEGDLTASVPPGVPRLEIVSTGDEEARVVLTGEPVEGTDPLFVGHIHDAVDFVFTLPPEDRETVNIWTSGRVYGPRDFERIAQERETGSAT